MSDDAGFRYLWSTVATGDVTRAASTPLTRYYTESGTPPGRWLGAGLAGLDGDLHVGSLVSEDAMFSLFGMAEDPTTGRLLGRRPQAPMPSLQRRISARVAALPEALGPDLRAHRIAGIEAEERARLVRQPVLGFDWTFSVPKSVSVLWAVADSAVQEQIVAAHHAAILDALDYAERDIAATRVGHAGIGQVAVRGLIAAGFDHFDSRANDPHLHTHVVITNRVQGLDGKWRTVDGAALFRATVALSELHQGLLMDRLTTVLGVGWDARTRARSDVPQWEITGVTDPLRVEFSRRTAAINTETNRLLAGRAVGRRGLLRVRQHATLITRPDKHQHSLVELTAGWRSRATALLGVDATVWSRRLLGRRIDPPDLSDRAVQRIAESVIDAVAERKAVFGRWNLHAESSRQLHGIRFSDPAARVAATDRVTDAAVTLSVRLTAPELAHTPVAFIRPDGTSVFRHRHTATLTTAAVLAAEDRLLTVGQDTSGPTARPLTAGSVDRLSADQAAAVASIVTSGRVLDVLVGPAGAGKTTTLAGLLETWVGTYGTASVIGLAPSAAAADVLSQDLGIGCENTAKFLHDETVLASGQLVIVDEASLAGTLALDRIVAQAVAVGAKVLLAGDPAQLSAVDAGGAFAMVARDRQDPPTLHDVHRFRSEWERDTTLDLRAGREQAIDTYDSNNRVHGAPAESTLDAAYAAWQADRAAGKSTLLIAADAQTVTDLNRRARADLVTAGRVQEAGVELADGTTAGVGDEIITRRNDRHLTTGRSWVKNGDRFTVTAVDGHSLTVQRPAGGTITLPAGYVAEHVELGYAVTAHRAQGRTVDTAHAVITPTATRETLYVAMTRGRDANHAWVVTDTETDPQTSHGAPPVTSARAVLTGVLQRSGADVSAHEKLTAELDTATGWTQLAAEYQAITARVLVDRYATVLARLDADSPIVAPLAAALNRAQNAGLAADQLPAPSSDNDALMLRRRLEEWATQRPTGPDALIAGLLQRVTGADPDTQRGLDDRAHLLLQRAEGLLTSALQSGAPWLRHLGPPQAPGWRSTATTIAAYRDRWNVTGEHPLGPPPTERAKQDDYLQAHRAVDSLTLDPGQSPYREIYRSQDREKGLSR